ncbi:MAG TPA: DciA family protein [Pseudomonas sp.]|uniref:DUF721 domain-containing protein n=1 Tax=Pseudomonas sp. TaxID=306 RepID=UPI002B466412|nr:DciA family protein [Pseudomonas sp.]HKS12896.1 DciA family protein [Pseudomonas sp.]
MAYLSSPARLPATLLRQARPLKALLNQAHRLSQLQRLVESQLQPAAREHCHVASWREGVLLLVVTNGHWATRLRYQQKRLQRQLQVMDAFHGLQRISFKVQPPAFHERPAGPGPALSGNAAQSIQATAESITNPNLRAALERLARHAPEQ